MGLDPSTLASNPAWQFVQPLFSVIAVVLLVVMLWRIFSNYFRGQHSRIIVEVIFALLAMLFLMDPMIFMGMAGYLANQLPHGATAAS